ncbi:ABC transporter ATP-binding protein [Rhodoferax aquaticus]|uniref:Sn-glycerol-3-phosphate ABC transporter ATP-binding protein UgpC n=1 Tax=Rhodoferax aquaticus TaxID=2527691 RepID=A0A515EMT0_9BURK|nr:sn-glycerol-3-phosphate ABC transporter ATP-binding protein UgpC [Rhodoferax aquaticus]QDL53938.1 sn-glycerol-3-phosphate ABC transporter ATP-binding protein UgpC [Rhodoferax aquaticus]
MSTLELRSVEKSFDHTKVIHGVNLEVKQGEFVVFVGPSGCGKSTLLRMIAGLDEPSAGDLLIEGQRVNDIGAADRGCAMVFQSYALYPHMTVYDNMAFGLENARVPRPEIERKVQEAATLLQLAPLLQRKPTQLSGGQRQRVAIGRAIVRNPKIFLFDEPLSNLDAELRVSMRGELRELHQRLSATMIYVTHDQVEAMTMADKIVVLRAGRIEQVGTPQALYDTPDNVFVAGFIGSPRMNFIPAATAQQDLAIKAALPPSSTLIGVRPEHWLPSTPEQGLAISVVGSEYLGAQRLVLGTLSDGTRVEILMDGASEPKAGTVTYMTPQPQRWHAFDGAEQRIAKTSMQ